VVNLSNPTGATLGDAQGTATITNDDAAPATPTPTVNPTPTPSATVNPTPTPQPGVKARPLNISTRARVQTGDNVLISGFIITGTAPKKLIVRAIGPSLTNKNVADPLADPVIELRGPGGDLIASNDNWKDSQQTEIEATTIPPTDDLESAIVATLDPNAYTAIVRGNGGTTGVALVEVYDLDQSPDSKLANISTRAFVDTGDNVVIGGFFLGVGADSSRIAFRGIGPSLADKGVQDVLADPVLELFDSNGTRLFVNDNFTDDPVQAAELTANGLAPSNNLESGIFATLPPGAFTVILSGNNGGTGVGLVEIYNVDN
jgi:hypothetical protein